MTTGIFVIICAGLLVPIAELVSELLIKGE